MCIEKCIYGLACQQYATNECKGWMCIEKCIYGLACQQYANCVSGRDMLRQVCVLHPSNMQIVSHGQSCPDNCKCCHIEIDVSYQTCYLTQSQYTDTGPTSPVLPGTWQVTQ